MAITNHERVGKALDLLRAGLAPFVERELKAKLGKDWAFELRDLLSDTRLGAGNNDALNDIAVLLVVMDRKWGDVFRLVLGRSERSLVNELIAARNRWAHQEAFSSDDAYRALDSAGRLLAAVSAPQADDVEKMKMELLRVRFDEQARGEKRKSAGTAIESAVTGALKPWREVVTPHADVASGRYQQAEFAADLWQVHLGEGSDEYRKPAEFFRRTFLTESLKRLLVGAVQRLSAQGGDPVVQLQTNFGGGKTHSMLALYHLFSGVNPSELAGVDAVLAEAGVKSLPKARRVVLVGNKISPGNPVTKPDGTVVRTLWGELAYQLGGKKGYSRIAQDDEKATSPGDVLRELFVEYGPCLVLIDEWVAYARQLHDQSDLPAGSFETQFTLRPGADGVGQAREQLPARDLSARFGHPGSPHTQTDDVEVGGIRGREALDRLRNVVGRVESSWRPATAEEGFEIVRRRLFEPLAGEQFKHRDVTARAFADLYHAQAAEFPPECKGSDYEKRIQAAYPIHPEIFDRLYTDWSTLVKFQRTRGVLRLMAAVIHSLWEKGDRNPLILPVDGPDRRCARAVRADALSLGQLGADHREGRGRPQLAAAQDRRRGAEPRQAARDAARGAHDLPRFRADGGRGASRPRGSAREARLRDAGRVAGGVRRCTAATRGGGDLSLSGRAARSGTRRSRRSPSSPRIAPSSSSAIPTRWRRSWTSGCAPTCRKTG